MRWNEAAEQYCSIARTLGILGDRWTLLIIREAFAGVRRFDDFRKHLDIARNVLTDRLQRLVDAGVFVQQPYQDNPPRSEYRLTEAGRDLHTVMVGLMQWGDRWLAGSKGPPLVLEHAACGHTGAAKLVCGHCAKALDAHNVRLREGPGLPKTVAASRARELERLRQQHGKPDAHGA
jgi:DNA-binding HxlR family transcriptional regulator